MPHVNKFKTLVLTGLILAITGGMLFKMLYTYLLPSLHVIGLVAGQGVEHATTKDTNWHAPKKTEINTLHSVINDHGTYGFIFSSSQTPTDVPYHTYNWCNMPHVRKQEYVIPPSEYTLEYVEVIHRHHKRTPYAANTFPVETQTWRCNNAALYQYAAPYPTGNQSARAYWRYYQSSINPFMPGGFPPFECEFPQITKQGLDDSFQHGRDLYGVYHDTVHLLQSNALSSGAIEFHVTNNVITSQVAGMLIAGMFGDVTTPVPLHLQAAGVDALEPDYSCPQADSLYANYGVGSSNPGWTKHLKQSKSLFEKLDAISGVAADDPDWHQSWDHYYDNLSARLCHQHPLPCNKTFNPSRCVTQEDADEVFRLGQYEYSYIYRDGGPESLAASKASFGIWIAELAQHLRDVSSEKGSNVVYRHNVAHDGSVSRLLSVLQLNTMVWPGMGSEVVFELYSRKAKNGHSPEWFVRVLWSGQVLESSSLGRMDMLPLSDLLNYFDALVGRRASKVAAECST